MQGIGVFVLVALAVVAIVCSEKCPPEPKCPENPGEQLQLLPVPWNCTQYIMCDNEGKAYYKPCPDGLVFNPKLKVCDHPSQYHCVPCEKEDNN